jgi:hypothetical protein
MRATEFIDFLNRESIDGCEDYTHLEIWEKDQDGKIKIKKEFAKTRKEYRSMIKKKEGK